MQDLDEDETIQSLVQLKDLRSFEQQQASGTKIEDKQREKEEEDGETSKTYVPEALAPSSTESVSTQAGAAPPNEEEEFRPPRSIAAITNEEKLKRAERRKAEGKGRKHDHDESDSDFEMNESEDPEEEEEEEEESEDASDDEYSEGERSRRRSSRESGASRRREHYDKETLFYVNGTLRERNFSDGGNASPSPSLLHAGSTGANSRMTTMLDKSAASKRKYNRFNRRNLSFDDRCQQLVEFKHTYGHCHVKRTHPGETKGLAYWVERQRMAWRKGTLELDKKKRLDDIGFVWEAGTNGSGSDELREYEALHASNRIKAELAESQSNLLAEPPGGFDGDHYEGSESAAQRDPTEGDAPAAGGRGESAERSGVTGEAPVPREESRERSRDDTVTRRGRLKLEEAKSFDDWCALLQQFKDKHGHCDVKRRYFGKNKGLAYWAERQRASRRKGSLEEEKINKLDSMGFVWGNNDGTVTPRKSSNGNDSMDYSFDASADGEMDETASPMEAAANDVATASTTTSITITPPPSTRHGVPRAVASALEDLDSGRQPHHQDSKKALEWERVHRKDREQLELLKRKLEEEERRARNMEKKIREEKREWEEESINLQLENCLLKEKLLTLDEELRANSQGSTAVSAFSAKRKRHDEAELVGQDLADEIAAEKRRKTTEPSAHEGGDDAAAADGQKKALLSALPVPAHVSADNSSASSSSTEPTDLWALLCALEGHLRSLVHDQKTIATHQRVLLDRTSTAVATGAADVPPATAADVDSATGSLSVSTGPGGSEAEPVELAVAAPTAESSASTPAEMMDVEAEGEGHAAAPVLDETDKETRATLGNETALLATSEQMFEQAAEPQQQGETESVAASEPPPEEVQEEGEEDPQPSL